MRPPARFLLALGVLLPALGCGDKGGSDETTSSSSTTGDSTTGDTASTTSASDSATMSTSSSSSSTSTSGTSATTTTTDSATTDAFVMEPDGGGGNECDPKIQDCMAGEKCTAWANDGGSVWNANKCVPETGNNQPGDPCLIEGNGVSGLDDCAKGGICLFSDENNMGVCIEFCTGANEDCPGSDPCVVANDGVLPLCLPGCNPLLQDCPMGQGCYDSPNGFFVCFADASGAGGLDGDPCPPADGENTCDPGLWCGPGSSGCNEVNCCTPYCDLSSPDCIGPDQCVSFYGDPNNAPPGFADVGVCVLP